MDQILDRVLQIIKDELPGILERVNSCYSQADIVKFGVPLALPEPVEYLHGKHFNFAGLPSLQAYSDNIDSDDGYAAGSDCAGIDRHSVIIELYWTADFSEPLNRMIRRYAWALSFLARSERFRFLRNAQETDGYAADGVLKNVSFNIVSGQQDVLFNCVRLEMVYTIPSLLIDNLIDL